MDNLKSPHEMSAHSHLPTILSHRLVFHAKKGGVNGGKNQSTEMYLSVIEIRYLAG